MDFFIRRLNDHDRQLRGDDPNTTVQLPETDRKRKVADENFRAYVRSRDSGHLDYIKIARKCDAYYSGDQWEQKIVDRLNAEERPHLTFNMVLSTINAVLGEHIKTRQEIAFFPRGKGANEDTARALNFTAKQIQYNNKSQWNEQMVLADGLIEDRGYFDMRISYEDNIYGEVRERVRDPRDVLLDPEAKEYDPSTWSEVTTTRWLTPDEVSAQFGEGAASQLRNKDASQRYSHDSIVFERPTQTFAGETSPTFMTDTTDDQEKLLRVRLIERQHKVLTRGRFYVDMLMGDMRRVPEHWDEVKIGTFAAVHNMDIIEKPERRIRWTVSADDVLLYDEWSMYTRFTIIPFFPYFRRGKPTGLTRHLLSPQDMLNKVTSQELHVVNTTANSGWMFESGSLINMDADDLEKVGAKTGLVLEYGKDRNPPTKIEPNQIPSGLSNVGTKAQVFFRVVSGLPEGFLGFSSREVSGVSLDEQRSAGSQSLEIVFDNLAKTRQYRAEMMLELIQNFYTEERMLRVTELDIDGNQISSEMPVNEMTPEGEILNDLTLGEYEVVVSSMPQQDTMNDTSFQQAVEMRQAGIAVPDFVVIENSRLDNRREIAEIVKKIQGMSEPTQQEAEMALMAQMLDLEQRQAQVNELQAKALEREANAQKLLAEADEKTKRPLLEMQKAGAEMRARLEEMANDLQRTREELRTRLEIAAQKNDTERFVAQTEALTKRTQSGVNRQTKLMELSQKATLDRLKILQTARSRSPKSANRR